MFLEQAVTPSCGRDLRSESLDDLGLSRGTVHRIAINTVGQVEAGDLIVVLS